MPSLLLNTLSRAQSWTTERRISLLIRLALVFCPSYMKTVAHIVLFTSWGSSLSRLFVTRTVSTKAYNYVIAHMFSITRERSKNISRSAANTVHVQIRSYHTMLQYARCTIFRCKTHRSFPIRGGMTTSDLMVPNPSKVARSSSAVMPRGRFPTYKFVLSDPKDINKSIAMSQEEKASIQGDGVTIIVIDTTQNI